LLIVMVIVEHMNQCIVWYYIFICVAILNVFFSFSHDKQNYQSFVVFQDGVVINQNIQQLCTTILFVKSLTFQSDIYFTKEEFFYLVGFNSEDAIDSSFLINAVECLSKKNKFSKIVLDIFYGENGVNLHFSFYSFWTFKKIKMHGIFRETNLYSQCYIINRGEYFDRSKHNHSIVKIKELLAQEGYHNNVVTTAFYYDKKTKEVIPHIYITKGKRFAFGKIIVEISGDDESSSYHLLKSQIVRRLSRTLLSQKYKKSLINHESMLLKKYLGRKGFLQIGLELEEIKNFS